MLLEGLKTTGAHNAYVVLQIAVLTPTQIQDCEHAFKDQACQCMNSCQCMTSNCSMTSHICIYHRLKARLTTE